MSDKKYQSPSSADVKCTAAQYITEIMITRQESLSGVRLPYKFWREEKYKRRFAVQILFVNKILKIYSPECVIAALLSKEGKSIYSLKNPLLDVLVQKQERKMANRPEVPVLVENTTNKPMKKFGSKSHLSKLRSLDATQETISRTERETPPESDGSRPD